MWPRPLQTAAGVTDLLDSVALEVSPLSSLPANGIKTYAGMVSRLKKALVPLLGVCCLSPDALSMLCGARLLHCPCCMRGMCCCA